MKKTLRITCLMLAVFPLLLTTLHPGVNAQKDKSTPRNPTVPNGDLTFKRRRLLISFRPEIQPDHARQIIAALNTRHDHEIAGIGVHVIELPLNANEQAFIKAFSSRPEVEFAEVDRRRPLEQLVPNDPYYGNLNAWSLDKIKAPEAWTMSTGSSNVVIAILDTGVDSSHVELAGKLIPGWNVYNQNADTSDVNGHGTLVAGTAAALSNNSVGVASVAWACPIMPVRVSDLSGYASESHIASGLIWAADHGAHVANVSYNVAGSSTISRAARYFQRAGGVVSVAAGNQGFFIDAPDDPNMLTVGATDSLDLIYSWSNTGGAIDLVAPGTSFTISRGGSYAVATGTSNAAPIVAGAAALMFSVSPTLTPQQVHDILKQSADDLGVVGWDSTYGWGRINLERALRTVSNPTVNPDSAPPTVSISSPVNGASVSGTVYVQVDTWDDVIVKRVELYVDGAHVSSSTTAPFTTKWNTKRYAAGLHTLQTKVFDGSEKNGTSEVISVVK